MLQPSAHNPALLEIAHTLPTSLYKLQKYFCKGVTEFTTYVVCSTLYKTEECIIKGRLEISRKCDHIEFPNHPHSSKRTKCGTILLKKVKFDDKFKLVPRKVYIYRSIVQTLKEMSRREGFLQSCEHWRDRTLPQGALGDICDGQVWKDVQNINGIPYLCVPNNLCLGLNIDWFDPFDPFEETQYSAGAIYLTVFNLPRAERLKFENIILVAMIPGPHEPSNLYCPTRARMMREDAMVGSTGNTVFLLTMRIKIQTILRHQ